jgi:hypothetical protein
MHLQKYDDKICTIPMGMHGTRPVWAQMTLEALIRSSYDKDMRKSRRKISARRWYKLQTEGPFQWFYYCR